MIAGQLEGVAGVWRDIKTEVPAVTKAVQPLIKAQRSDSSAQMAEYVGKLEGYVAAHKEESFWSAEIGHVSAGTLLDRAAVRLQEELAAYDHTLYVATMLEIPDAMARATEIVDSIKRDIASMRQLWEVRSLRRVARLRGPAALTRAARAHRWRRSASSTCRHRATSCGRM